MPQILRNVNDSITVTLDASNARYPTAVVLPMRGTRPGQAEVFMVTPKTNEARICWDGAELAAVAVASSHLVPAAATMVHPIPWRSADNVSQRRYVAVLDIVTALADTETLTFTDGSNTLVLEADPSNNGVTGGRTEIGTNASTAATQAAGIAAAINTATIDISASVDVDDDTRVVLMGQTAAATIGVTGASVSVSGDVTTIDTGTGGVTVTDYGNDLPILYVLSETTSTAVSVSSVGY